MPETPQEKLDACPNCTTHYGWRREEHYCTWCDWGKPKSKPMSDEEVSACCGIFFSAIVLPLVFMGMGYTWGGVGGLVAGLGLGLAIPCGLVFYIIASTSAKKTEAEIKRRKPKDRGTPGNGSKD